MQEITVAGHTFKLRLTHDVFESIEQRLYQRRLDALKSMKDAYPSDVYVSKLNTLLQQLEDGEFDVMQSEAIQKWLQTDKGCVFLLAVLGNMTEKELLPLWMENQAEFQNVIKSAFGISFPKDERPPGKRSKTRRPKS